MSSLYRFRKLRKAIGAYVRKRKSDNEWAGVVLVPEAGNWTVSIVWKSRNNTSRNGFCWTEPMWWWIPNCKARWISEVGFCIRRKNWWNPIGYERGYHNEHFRIIWALVAWTQRWTWCSAFNVYVWANVKNDMYLCFRTAEQLLTSYWPGNGTFLRFTCSKIDGRLAFETVWRSGNAEFSTFIQCLVREFYTPRIYIEEIFIFYLLY